MRLLRTLLLTLTAVLLCGGLALAAGYCVKCGEALPDAVNFCPDCGHKVGAPLPQKQPAAETPQKKAPPAPAPVYRSIEEANNYFELAEEQRRSVGAFLLPHLKKRRYAKALSLYQAILTRWPTSDKCEEAAYQAANIYASVVYRDYNTAIRYYKLVVAINPRTTLPARLQQAALTEEEIRDFETAATLYQACLDDARVQDEKQAAAEGLARVREKQAEARSRLAEARER